MYDYQRVSTRRTNRLEEIIIVAEKRLSTVVAYKRYTRCAGELGTSAHPKTTSGADCNFARGQRVANWRAITFSGRKVLEASFDLSTANLRGHYGVETILIVSPDRAHGVT